MLHKIAHIDFLQSAFNTSGEFITTDNFLKWLEQRRASVTVSVEMIPFRKLNKWRFNEVTGNLEHETGRFFSIEGIEIKTSWGKVPSWSQPIINQPEIGFLGIIAKKINGVLHFLMQSKIEPGNINYVQVSPTLQATKSNYTKVHAGKAPLYLEYFNGTRKSKVILDQLQSEQGARFLKKRNRNIIIEIDDDITVADDFCWLTLGQLKSLMRYSNLVNMDTRTVLSGISFGSTDDSDVNELFQERSTSSGLLYSALDSKRSLNSFEEILSWITGLKSNYELDVKSIPLKSVQGWVRDEDAIHHQDNKYFSVIAANVLISNREVTSWSQPLVRSAQEGLIAFIIRPINGVIHFLVQAKIEAGNFDILELAPTVQCLTGNYRKGLNEYEVPFIQDVLQAPASGIVYNAMQSEEGGRFYQEQNLNRIVLVDERFPVEVPENYCWMTLSQLYTFIKFNNYLNIQARSLIAAVTF
jgi:dTDP-4-dehydro-6-deoxy-alpha-D-glucopyranose 2,3-dehydratase